ncbi:MAG: heavy metal translocating P-type ATPase [Synergistales bacterium]
MEHRIFLKGLCCAQCAADMERNLQNMEGVRSVRFNLATGILFVETGDVNAVIARVRRLLPEVEARLAQPGDRVAERPAPTPKEVWKPVALPGALFVAGWLLSLAGGDWAKPAAAAVFTGTWLFAGLPVFRSALAGITARRPFDESFLMSIATTGALALGAFPEAAGVMIFYRVGMALEDLAVARSRRSIQGLLEARPAVAWRRAASGLFEDVPPEEIAPGEVLRVLAGERIPVDGMVEEGEALVDLSALTGEPFPTGAAPGAHIRAGGILVAGTIVYRATAPFRESSIARILDLVENAASRKSSTERFISRFSRIYTPAVVLGAATLAILPPLLLGGAFSVWAYRALVLLVVSCPCALVIGIPLGYFAGIGAVSRAGVLVKGAAVLDALADVKTVLFDKTGTLTHGVLKVVSVETAPGFDEAENRRLAASAEAWSVHPAGKALVGLVSPEDLVLDVKDVRESLGRGLSALVGGRRILAGTGAYLEAEGVPVPPEASFPGMTVHLAVGGIFAGSFFLSDAVREEAAGAVRALRKAGVRRVVMVSGDREENARQVAEELGLDACRAGLLPEQKVEELEKILATDPAERGRVAFVGDGLNDAPSLARADVGIAMGGASVEAALETADAILSDDRLSRVSKALSIAHRTRRIARQNIVLTLGIKGLVLALGVFGEATLGEAVFADVGVTLLAVANARRLLEAGLN